MIRTTRIFSKASAAALCLALVGVFSAAAHAASISYGNFGPVPPGFTFINVTESSGTDPVPLYGPPSPFIVGLDFTPLGFTSFSNGGSADITDGQLNFTVAGPSVDSIQLTEAGDYTIAGAGTPATSVFAGAIIRATITQVNGLPVAPINVVPVNASFGDSLPGTVIVGPWSLGLTLNIAAALPANQHATRVDISINNSLVTTSEPGTVAFIAKKEFQIRIPPNIPEPATMALAGFALCGLGLVRRSRS